MFSVAAALAGLVILSCIDGNTWRVSVEREFVCVNGVVIFPFKRPETSPVSSHQKPVTQSCNRSWTRMRLIRTSLPWVFSGSAPTWAARIRLSSARNIWAAVSHTLEPDLEHRSHGSKIRVELSFFISRPKTWMEEIRAGNCRFGRYVCTKLEKSWWWSDPPVTRHLALKSLLCAQRQSRHEGRGAYAGWPWAFSSALTSSDFHQKRCMFDINLALQKCWRLVNMTSISLRLTKPCWNSTQNAFCSKSFCQNPLYFSSNRFSDYFFCSPPKVFFRSILRRTEKNRNAIKI